MSKVLLTKNELLELDRMLIDTYAFFQRLRARSSVARLIHYPSVPAEFSESLIIHCVEYFFGENWAARFNGDISDVILEKVGKQQTVEVKATGHTNLQEIKPKDLTADFLIWVHFGNRFIEGSSKLDVYILRNPKKYLEKPLRLKLRDFLKRTNETPDLTHFEVESLEKLLNP